MIQRAAGKWLVWKCVTLSGGADPPLGLPSIQPTEAQSPSQGPGERHARCASLLPSAPLCPPLSPSALLCPPLGMVTLQLALAQRSGQLLILVPFRSLGSRSQDFALFLWWHFHVTSRGKKKTKQTRLLLVK